MCHPVHLKAPSLQQFWNMARENSCVKMGVVLFPYLTGHVNNLNICHFNTEECVSKKHPQTLTCKKYLRMAIADAFRLQLMCWWVFVCVCASWQTLDESLLLQTQLSRIESSSFQIMLTLTTLLPSGELRRMRCRSQSWRRKTLWREVLFLVLCGHH